MPFWGCCHGLGDWFCSSKQYSSGGTDIVSSTIRKKTGRNVGSISFLVNGTIMLIAGLTFGWKYALYSMITIFVPSRSHRRCSLPSKTHAGHDCDQSSRQGN